MSENWKQQENPNPIGQGGQYDQPMPKMPTKMQPPILERVGALEQGVAQINKGLEEVFQRLNRLEQALGI